MKQGRASYTSIRCWTLTNNENNFNGVNGTKARQRVEQIDQSK